MSEFALDAYDRKMSAAVDVFKRDIGGLRTGRASTSLLDNIQIEAYGSRMPINQVATVAAPEPRLLVVTVWDASQTKAVEKAIRESDLGLNPQGEGTVIRVPLPSMSEERRNEMVKAAGKYAESGRVAVRNVRRDALDAIKKDKAITEDQQKTLGEKVQKATDAHVKEIDELLVQKEKEIKTV